MVRVEINRCGALLQSLRYDLLNEQVRAEREKEAKYQITNQLNIGKNAKLRIQ